MYINRKIALLIILLILPILLQCQNIDLIWQTFIGGIAMDEAHDIAMGDSGNIYIVGRSFGTWGKPIRGYSNEFDAVVVKINKNGEVLWNTFLGGSWIDDGESIAVDQFENIYVTGTSRRAWGTPIQEYSGERSIYIAKLSSDGKLKWHTFVGNESNSISKAITVDKYGDIIVTGWSESIWGNPIRTSPYLNEIVVVKLTSDGDIKWNTFLGNGIGFHIITDNKGFIYMAGQCGESWGNPMRSHSGKSDAIIAKLSPNGNLNWHTLLGGPDYDTAFSLAVSKKGNIYMTGRSRASWGNPLNPFTDYTEILVSKLGPNGKLIWNSFFGAANTDEGYNILLDNSENLYILGSSGNIWGNPRNQIGPASLSNNIAVAKITPEGSLLWNAFYGGVQEDRPYGALLDKKSNTLYIAGKSTQAWGNPINSFSGAFDIFVLKIAENYSIPTHEIYLSTSTEGGSIGQEVMYIKDGEDCKININVNQGYSIDKIVDNGIEMEISNPYIIQDVQEKHYIQISFKKILYPPELHLSGNRETETSWIISKDYVQLNISMKEHESPIPVNKYVLYKFIYGWQSDNEFDDKWEVLTVYNNPGIYTLIDDDLQKNKSPAYQLKAFHNDEIIVVSDVLYFSNISQ